MSVKLLFYIIFQNQNFVHSSMHATHVAQLILH
jgi:hypothetical protein